MSNSHTALFLSISLHVGVVTVAYVGLPSLLKEPPTPIPPISIEFVKVAEETKLSAPKEQKKEPEAAPQKTSQYSKAEAYEPEAAASAVPTLKAAKVAKPKPRRKPELSQRQKLVSTAKPRSRPKPPSRFKVNKLAALIDKSIKKDTEVAQKPVEDAKDTKAKSERPLFGSIKNKIATASLIEAFKQKVITCWSLPSGVKNIQDMRVTVRVWLRKDGKLLRNPAFVGAGNIDAEGRENYRAFAESARRAVKICEPYENLPKERYEEWRVIDFNFDPSDMY